MKERLKVDEILEIPNYSPAEAARYFHIAPSTLRYWTSGANALVKLASARPPMLSFKNLVEFYVLEGLRKQRMPMRSIRLAVGDLLKHENSRHPLADFDLRILNNRHLVLCNGQSGLNVSLGGQYEVMDWIRPYLRRVDRSPAGKAQKIFPYVTKMQIAEEDPPRSVVIDPTICFGLPVLAGSRITTGFIASRYRGGDSLADIANSYDRPLAEIKEAIEWETGKKAA